MITREHKLAYCTRQIEQKEVEPMELEQYQRVRIVEAMPGVVGGREYIGREGFMDCSGMSIYELDLIVLEDEAVWHDGFLVEPV